SRIDRRVQQRRGGGTVGTAAEQAEHRAGGGGYGDGHRHVLTGGASGRDMPEPEGGGTEQGCDGRPERLVQQRVERGAEDEFLAVDGAERDVHAHPFGSRHARSAVGTFGQLTTHGRDGQRHTVTRRND